MTESLPGWLAGHLQANPGDPAIACDGRGYSYAEFAGLVAGYVGLLGDGLEAGARVAYLGANSADELALVFACSATGCALVPLNWRLAAAELDRIIADAAPSMIFVEPSCAALAAQLGGSPPQRPLLRDPMDASPQAIADALLARPVEPDAPLLLCYTSGTTGLPKGAVLSSRTIVSNAWNAIDMHGLGRGDRILTVLPLFHVGGLNIQTLPALRCGAEVVLLPRFEPQAALDALVASRASLTVMVPTMLQALEALPGFGTADLRALRAITTGSTDVPRALIERWLARGVPLIQVYGATETGPVAIYQRVEEARSTLGAIGRPGRQTSVRLVRADGSECAVDEAGEILLRGDHVVRGYWRGAHAEAFRDGWFSTGDVASRDAGGVYWFRDRLKNVIISGGENIYPAEIERVLRRLPAVREVAVVGRADPVWGAVPVAVLEADEDPAPDAISAACAGQLARYKWPKGVLRLDALPRTALGKVDLAALRLRVAQEMSPEPARASPERA